MAETDPAGMPYQDANKTLTDGLIGKLYAKFPIGRKPHAFFLSRRSLGQLQGSRTAVNPTGTEAPIPDNWQGIPLIPTDSILDTEALTL